GKASRSGDGGKRKWDDNRRNNQGDNNRNRNDQGDNNRNQNNQQPSNKRHETTKVYAAAPVGPTDRKGYTAAEYSYSDTAPEMSDMQAELLALREQWRIARQSGPEARIPEHQEASRGADSHI
ncbi:hypothetical protein Tco_0334575, partial [Tanacetum coccineum]